MAHSFTGPGVRSITADPTALRASAADPNGMAASWAAPSAVAAAAVPLTIRRIRVFLNDTVSNYRPRRRAISYEAVTDHARLRAPDCRYRVDLRGSCTSGGFLERTHTRLRRSVRTAANQRALLGISHDSVAHGRGLEYRGKGAGGHWWNRPPGSTVPHDAMYWQVQS